MRKNTFTWVLKLVGFPLFLIKWIVDFICSFTYKTVGIMYKTKSINGPKVGKKAYAIISSLLLVGIVFGMVLIKK